MSRYANSIFNNLNQNYPAVQNPKLHNDAWHYLCVNGYSP
jgi:hypothetical protein